MRLKLMATVTSMKCACENCLCVVSLEDAVKKDDKYYCCEACANGHANNKGCEQSGCGCC